MIKKIILWVIVLTMGITVYGQQKKTKAPAGTEKKPAAVTGTQAKKNIERHEKKVRKFDKEWEANAGHKTKSTMWDVQFKHDVEIGSGIETNGFYYYVSQWNNDTI